MKADGGGIGNWFSDKFSKNETVHLEDPEFEKGLKEKSNLNLKPFLEVCMKLYALSGLDEEPTY